MKPVDNDTVLRQLQWRYAVKKFDASRAIPESEWRTLEQALVLTPSSYGLQPWKFLVVTDPKVKSQLPAISWNQRQPADASHVVVFAARTDLSVAEIDRYLARIVEVRGGSFESLAGFRKMLIEHADDPPMPLEQWAQLQVYIALGSFMTAAAMMGIDTCPMEGIEPARYDELFGLREQGLATAVVCVAGYRSVDDKYATVPKVRYRPEEVVFRI